MATNSWLLYALGSAFFAALTAVFGKIAVADIGSNLATFIRTVIILGMVASFLTFRSEWVWPDRLSRNGLAMLVASGIATGLSWLCYYHALQLGPASRVAPVDKLSVVLVIVFSVVFLGETLDWKLALGGAFIIIGTALITLR